MDFLKNIIVDTVLDSVGMLPFLFGAFLLLEALEHYSSTFVTRILTKLKKTGPLIGAVFGCIPQCGFSVMATNLYAGGVVSLGTLLSVYLATSDEAILILMGHPGKGRAVLLLLIVKIVIAITAGYFADFFLEKKISEPKQIGIICSHCGCHEHKGIIQPALRHTLQIFGFILLFSGILNLLTEGFGLASISRYLLQGSIAQPFFTALIGLIPNCASSVLLTELYLTGTLSFASVVAGLCTNAGVGLMVLFHINKNRSENLRILGLLYAISVLFGCLLSALSGSWFSL